MNTSNLPSDIRAKIVADFGPSDLFRVSAYLAEYSDRERDRVWRCILHLAAGSHGALLEFVDLAKADYRDVIWSAEYDGGETRLRNFTKPFPGYAQ